LSLSAAGTLSGTPTTGGSFNFTVTATDSSTGSGPYTGSHAFTLSIGQAAQAALTATATPSAITSGGAPTTLGSSGGSGSGAVSYAATGSGVACTVTGNALSASGGTGTCSVTATKAADASYLAVSSASITVSVSAAGQATLTANATPATITSGDVGTTLATTGGSGSGTVTYSLSGSSGVSCVLSGSTLTASGGAGSCTVVASKAAQGNYAAAVSAPLTVTVAAASQAALSVIATPPAIVSGDAGTTLSTQGGSGSGAVSYAATGSGVTCTIAGSTLTASGASGTCSVTASKAAQGNYADAISAPLIVSVAAATTATATTLTATPSNPFVGQAVKLSATISVASATGTVSFLEGSTLLGSVALAGGKASFETSALGVGNHALTAHYSGDAKHDASTSSAANVAVQARPNPAADPRVRAQLAAQATAVHHFSLAQIENIHQRLDMLHDGARDAFASRLSLNVSSRSLAEDAIKLGEQVDSSRLHHSETPANAMQPRRRNGLAIADEAERDAAKRPRAELANEPLGSPAYSVWTSGVISFGKVSSDGLSGENRFHTSGVTAGADTRVNPRLRAGFAVGYGDDRTDIGTDGEHSGGRSTSAALYGSYKLGDAVFVDALTGYGRAKLDSRRWVPDAGLLVDGARSAKIVFGSIALVGEQKSERFALSPYGRVDFLNTDFAAYAEQGDPQWALSYAKASMNATSAVLGVRGKLNLDAGWGLVAPMWNLEVRHMFDGNVVQSMSYVTDPAMSYSVVTTGGVQNTVTGSVGVKVNTTRGVTSSLEYMLSGSGSGNLHGQGLRVAVEMLF
jgi:uncharacterized protein with beta-barrel porin domain